MLHLQLQQRIQSVSKSNPCPACGGIDWCYSLASGEILGCYRSTDAPSGYRKTKQQPANGATQFALEKEDQGDWAAKKQEFEQRRAEREANELEASQKEMATWLSAEQRDPLIRQLSAELSLSAPHQSMLEARGLTREQIRAGLFFSIEQWQKVPEWAPLNLPGVYLGKFGDRQLNGKGIAIVTFSPSGLATGWQIMNDDPRPTDLEVEANYSKYKWAAGKVPSHLPIGNKELPIQVVKPATAQGDPYLLEGTLKPMVAAHRHSIITIGASSGLFRKSPEQVKTALEGIDRVNLPIDAGDTQNTARVRHWALEIEWLQSIGKEVFIAWWGQETKEADDLDELASLDGIEYLTAEKWLEMATKAARRAADLAIYQQLTRCTKKPDQQLHEANLQALPVPRSGSMQLVSSAVATGKTKQLATTIDNWLRIKPDGRVLMLGYRNGLLDNAGERLGFPSYRVGHGCDDSAIATFPKLRICLDSLLRLKLEDIPAGSLIILDEVEAILEHGAGGGTLGSNTAAIQAQLVAIIDRVLGSGGALIGLEDSLTDISVDGLQMLTEQKYPVELISNSFEKFDWQVSIGRASQGAKIAYIIDLLMAGKTVAVPTTSQRFGEALERMVLARMPELEGKVARLDAKTSPYMGELKENPDKYLADHQTRLLTYTSVVESGFSIEQYKFDRVVANICNLTTRTQVQMLSRVRSNCPRDIFVNTKGAEAADNQGRDPKKLLKLRQIIADKTSLQQGLGKIVLSSAGEVWNWLDCQFAARAALSAKYLAELLEADLVGRGHAVTAVDWPEVIKLTHDISIEDCSKEYKAVRELIEAEENKILADANGQAIEPHQAMAILHSSEASFEKRQQAKKCLLHQDLPGAKLTEEFLMAAVTKERGAYLRACTLAFMVANPKLANQLDAEAYAAQRLQPHILLKRVPKLRQKVELFGQMADQIADLASGREYREDDPAVIAIQSIALQKGFGFWSLFGLNIRPEGVDSSGRTINSAIATTNKIIKKLGYRSEVVSKEGGRGNQIRVYQVANANCPHRQTILDALEQKYGEKLESLAQTAVVTFSNTEETLLKNVTTVSNDTKPPDPPPEDIGDILAILGSLQSIMAGTLEEITEGLVLAKELWGQQVAQAAALLSADLFAIYQGATA
jgi:hypothetical protein